MAKKAAVKNKKAAASEEEVLKDEETTEETEETVDEEGSEEEADESKNSADSVDVIKGNTYVRTFSAEVHGEDFKSLAEQFISKPEYSKRAYTLVPSSTIKAVRVLYREKEDAEKPLDEQKPDSPIVDKEKKFTDKEAALAFNIVKKGSIVIIR